MYRLRFLRVILQGFLTKSKNLMSEFDLKFFIVPLIDTDLSRVFTQTYGLFMGLGRWHIVFNSEFRTAAFKKAWVPVTTAEMIVYKRSVKAFSTVTLKTKLLCWDERRFYLEQSFYVKGQIHAQAFVEGLIRSPKGTIRPTEFFSSLGVKGNSPEFPEHIISFQKSLGTSA